VAVRAITPLKVNLCFQSYRIGLCFPKTVGDWELAQKEAKAVVLEGPEWHQSVAQCVHMDAVQITLKVRGLSDRVL